MDKLEFESMTLCPLDGRYGKIKDQLADCFSEYAVSYTHLTLPTIA